MMRNTSLRLKTRVSRIVAASFILQLAGFVSPGWIITRSSDRHGNYLGGESSGVWYTHVCTQSGNCETTSLLDVELRWTSTQIQTSVALVATILYFIVPDEHKDPISSGEIRKNLGLVLLLLADGILSLTSTGQIASGIIRRLESNSYSKYYFPPSLVLFAAGGVLLIIVCFLMISDVLTRINSAYMFRNTDNGVPTLNTIPMLNIPPSTQQLTHQMPPAYVQQPTNPVQPAHIQKPTNPTQPALVQQPTNPVPPALVQNPTNPTQPAHVQQPTNPTQPAHVQQPTNPTQPALVQQPTNPVQPTHVQYQPTQGKRLVRNNLRDQLHL